MRYRVAMPTPYERLGLVLTESQIAGLRELLADLQERRLVSRRLTINQFAARLVLLSVEELAENRPERVQEILAALKKPKPG